MTPESKIKCILCGTRNLFLVNHEEVFKWWRCRNCFTHFMTGSGGHVLRIYNFDDPISKYTSKVPDGWLSVGHEGVP